MPCSTEHKNTAHNVLFYTGTSMHPALKPGDELRLSPCTQDGIQAGDIVVFRPPQSSGYCVHRVVAVMPEGIKTRGDNNAAVDPWTLSIQRLLGRVVSVKRGGAVVCLRRGFRNALAIAACRIRKRADVEISRMLRPVYCRLARPSAVKRLLWQVMPVRVTAYGHGDGTEMHLLLGGRVIGRRMSGEASWRIVRPFRLVVDERFLPHQHSPVRRS